MKKVKSLLPIASIILVGAFFRLYRLAELYNFAHDQDLYSWIVKDMLVEGHIRLIGQLTSYDGVFIGPYFYYFLVPFYKLFNFDPIGATLAAAGIGLLTIYSIYFVFSRVLDNNSGLAGAFLYAVAWGNVAFDRWVVPTQPTVLWSVWFMYAVYQLINRKPAYWILVGFLTGLIWHIHIGLLPLIPIPLVFAFRSRIWPGWKILLLTVLAFLLSSGPFWVFELRHGFLQTQALFANAFVDAGYPKGWQRFIWVLDNAGYAMRGNLFSHYRLWTWAAPLPLILSWWFVARKKKLSVDVHLFLGVWIFLIILAQLISKKGISEYYFMNLVPVFLLLFSAWLANFFRKNMKIAVWLLAAFTVMNAYILFTVPTRGQGYLAKKNTVERIAAHATENNYPCVSITYIADIGYNVGFRYFFWLNRMRLINPNTGAPIYNVFVGNITAGVKDLDYRFNEIGVIYPKEVYQTNEEICQRRENQLQPLLGFTN